MKTTLAVASLLCLAACNPKDSDDPFDAQDQFKPVNEQIFAFNLKADKYVIKPVIETYQELPEWSRAGFSNFFTNLSEPENTVNGLLQLDPKIAFTSFWRFTLNSTFGFAGFRDFAAENGLAYQDTDFGKTLGRYGVPNGPYIVLPLAGPSTVRDTAGMIVDGIVDPVGRVLNTPESIAQTLGEAVTTRDEISEVINKVYYESIDPYSATRAMYLQHSTLKPDGTSEGGADLRQFNLLK